MREGIHYRTPSSGAVQPKRQGGRLSFVDNRLCSTIQTEMIGAIQRKGDDRSGPISGKPTQLQVRGVPRAIKYIAGNTSPHAPVQGSFVGIEMETIVPLFQKGERLDHVDGYAAQACEYDHRNVDNTLRKGLGEGFELHVDSSTLAPKQALRIVNPDASMHIMEIVSKPVASRQALFFKLQAAKHFLEGIRRARIITGDGYSVGWPVPVAPFDPDDSGKMIPLDKLKEAFERDFMNGQSGLFQVASQLTCQISPEQLSALSDQDIEKYDTGQKESVTRQTTVTRGKSRVSIPRTVMRPIMQDHPVVNRASMAEAMFLSDSLDGSPRIRMIVDVVVKIFKDMLKLLTGPMSGTIKNSVSYLVRSNLGALFSDILPDHAKRMADHVSNILNLTDIEDFNIPERLLVKIYNKRLNALILNPIPYKVITDPVERDRGELEHINPALRESLRTKTIYSEDTSDYNWPWPEAMMWLGNEVRNAIIGEKGDVTGPLHGSSNLGILPTRDVDAEITEQQRIANLIYRRLEHPEETRFPEDVVEKSSCDTGLVQPAVVLEDRTPIVFNLNGKMPGEVEDRLDQMGFPR